MLLVVGGHSRNIGKTSVVAGIIAATRELDWTALKITQFGHGICAASGAECDCHLAAEHPYAIVEEAQPNAHDSGRFLAAGARRSLWVRTAMGRLECALPALRQVLAASGNVIVESNSIMQFVAPSAYLAVLDFGVQDFKASTQRFLGQADALVVIDRGLSPPAWDGVDPALWQTKPRFAAHPPQYVSPELAAFVRSLAR